MGGDYGVRRFCPGKAGKIEDAEGCFRTGYVSLSLGQANNYINNVENKKTLPSMQSFFYICEYLGVTPQEFFDEGNPNPAAWKEFITEAKKLDSKAMSYILGIMKELNSKK